MYEGETKAYANFYAEITGMDAAMGQLREGIRKLGRGRQYHPLVLQR